MTASAVATFMGAVTGEPPSCQISSTLSCVLRMLICISSVQLNRVGEHADPADVDFDSVTVLHENRGLEREAAAACCAGRDDVTRLQIENRRQTGHHLRDKNGRAA